MLWYWGGLETGVTEEVSPETELSGLRTGDFTDTELLTRRCALVSSRLLKKDFWRNRFTTLLASS